jgi:anti-anti-sigma factor
MSETSPAPERPAIEVIEQRDGAALVLAVHGRIDAHTAKLFEAAVLPRAQAGESSLVLDLDGLKYISSAGLRVIMLAAKQQKQRAAKFALCNLHDDVRDVFEVSGFAKIIDIHPSREAAVAA